MYSIRFDMRAPAFGAAATDLYAAAIDMSVWAEQHGALAAVLCEHHGSADGYLPSPLVLAAAIAARTERLVLSLVVILPFYDPVRLAEEIAVLDIIAAGRASYVFGLGYRRAEFEHFGLDRTKRGKVADERIVLLRALLSGDEVIHDGRRIKVTPQPATPGGPATMWGGASLAAARRAGRYGLGLLANGSVPGMREAYEAACRDHGHPPGPALLPDPDTPSVTFVADDVDAAWEELGEYLLHDARSYAEWNQDNDVGGADNPSNVGGADNPSNVGGADNPNNVGGADNPNNVGGADNPNNASAGISFARNVAELRDTSTSHRIIATAEAVDIVKAGALLNLAPLCGGVPPDIAWPYLKRVGEVVLPEATRTVAPSPRADGLGNAFNELMSTKGTCQ